jgi:Bacterial Ig domain
MKKGKLTALIYPTIFLVLFFTTLLNESFGQCTLVQIRTTTSINTPGHLLPARFTTNTTAPAVVNGLGSGGIFKFRGAVSGGATWNNPTTTGGIQIQNDMTAGDFILVQPTNLPSNVPANVATYGIKFTEPVYNFTVNVGGVNNNDQLRITAANGLSPITINASNITVINNDPMNGGTMTVTGNTVTSTNTAGGTGVNTNVFNLTIPGPVDTITFVTNKSNTSTSTVTLGFTSFSYRRCVTVPPDLNATFANVAVTGNVSTNDAKPAGTTYGTAVPLPLYTNPDASTPTINSDGTYSFTSPVTGVFKFLVPMCIPSVLPADCPQVLLVITVKDVNSAATKPTANIDRATTPLNTAVTLNTLANDASGKQNTTLNPGSVTVTVPPNNGTTSVNAATGNITYTPNAGFTGMDTLTYRVCDNSTPTPLCETSLQIITVNAAGAANTTAAADDYKRTLFNTAIIGFNVLTNDNDPEANTQTVTAQNTTQTGKGTLVLNTDGTYTFTPSSGYTGPVNFPYQLCDNGTPVACTNATLYILIEPSSILPVSLTSFDLAVRQASVTLNWVSATELNFSHFEIERSVNGPSNFIYIGTINSTNSRNYSFTDVNAALNGDIIYYRLKMIDVDNKFVYSKVIAARFDNTPSIIVRPSIVNKGDLISVILPGISSKYTISLYSGNGQLVDQKKPVAGNLVQFNTTTLSKGIYLIYAQDGATVQKTKILIQ